MMYQSMGVMGTPNIGFFALIIIGGLAGWIAGMFMKTDYGIFTNILIGICGSFVGSKLAELADILVIGKLGQFIAALVGSVVVIYVWQQIQKSRQSQ